jgi:hypothetical protein
MMAVAITIRKPMGSNRETNETAKFFLSMRIFLFSGCLLIHIVKMPSHIPVIALMLMPTVALHVLLSLNDTVFTGAPYLRR